MSYDQTAKLLEEVLPMDASLNAFTIRQHVFDVAQRLEDEMGEEQPCFIEGCQRDWDRFATPDGPLTVGIDGGYVRGRHKEGHFEVIAGKSILAFRRDQDEQESEGKCFAFVQTYDQKPKRRLFELLKSQGMIYKVDLRRRCNKLLRNSVHHWADRSRLCSSWAAAYYGEQRRRGKSHACALRALGQRWLKILWKMLQTNRPYDPNLHAKSQLAHGSWVLKLLRA